jgi:putative endonuclease
MKYYTYILANKKHGTLYVGVTNNLVRRMYEHKYTDMNIFTHKYDVKRLVYFEKHYCALDAIAREKQLKNWRRQWKIALIEEDNPDWLDLSYGMTFDDFNFADW